MAAVAREWVVAAAKVREKAQEKVVQVAIDEVGVEMAVVAWE